MADYIRNKRKPINLLRLLVQIVFVLLLVWIGVEFGLFVHYLESGGDALKVTRPPGVEGFLPISSLMNLYYFILTGHIHPVHPSGFFIFLSILLMSLIFPKSFCSWLCPVGLLSEKLADLGEKIFGRKFRMAKWLDTVLRGVKYLLLVFFFYVIFTLGKTALDEFLSGDYNKVADIKMYYFFAKMTLLTAIVLAVLVVFSVFFRGFWCRYLCPYGALLGLTGLSALFKIRRNEVSCINCGKCAKVCPSMIKVDKVNTVISDECTSCLRCIDACPVADTLDLKITKNGKAYNPLWTMIMVIAVFILMTGLGMILGKWQTNISDSEYKQLIENAQHLEHPR